MAQYKVPQNVEADDKLLGPFSFRQFVHLAIAGGGIALAVALFQLFPLLAIIPVPIVLFFAILALPLKKDQPMETYLVAIISYYFKPRKRFWIPGQRETTVQITAPKVVDKPLARDISREEASHRLSFLSELIDTEGRSIQNGAMNADFVAEANNAHDMFDMANTNNLNTMIERDASARRAEIIDSMRDAANETANQSAKSTSAPQISHGFSGTPVNTPETATASETTTPAESPQTAEKSTPSEPSPATSESSTDPALVALATDPDLSVKTIAKEAKRVKSKKKAKDEVFISLH